MSNVRPFRMSQWIPSVQLMYANKNEKKFPLLKME
jgi:hypothetical protein